MDAKAWIPNGQKRRAEDDLRNEQRLAKRFDLLNLEQNGKLYLPVSAPLISSPATSYTPTPDSMQVDDTNDRIYIHNLDEEVSDIEREEESLIFLPDIEKKLGKIPKSVLTGDVHPSAQGKQMVLYGVPESLSLPKEKDSVKKAILEARERARDRQAEAIKETLVNGSPARLRDAEKGNGSTDDPQSTYIEDEEAMDLE